MTKRPDVTREQEIAGWIDRHVAKAPLLLPCRVDEMTDREAEIFKVAAYHLGFIQFLRSTLPRDLAYYPPGRFGEVVANILRESKGGHIEYGPPINFVYDEVEAPKDLSLIPTDDKD